MVREVVVAFGLVLALAGCKSGAAARSDGGVDARAPLEAGAVEGGSPSNAAGGDAAPADDGSLPAATSDELTLRAQHLFEAVRLDNPDLASDILFPRDAFETAHDATDPGKVWDVKLGPSFRRGVHSLHKRTKGIERAQFVSFEIGRTVTQEAPRKHEWKETLWVVHHARIDFTLDGRDLHFDIAELTSWRGAWYVTRLRGS